MRRPSVQSVVRLFAIGVGVFCFGIAAFFACSFWIQWRTADGIVESRPAPDRPSNIVRHVRYTRPNGTETSVPFPEETLPASAAPGDHVRVAYIPDSKTSIVYTFRSVWQFPTIAGTVGLVLTLAGFYFLPRQKVLAGGHA